VLLPLRVASINDESGTCAAEHGTSSKQLWTFISHQEQGIRAPDILKNDFETMMLGNS
jgi:hypothetical protein